MATTVPQAAAPWHWLQARWTRWWDAHHPRRDQLSLTHRNVYILPTASGLLFLALLLTLLLASINYQLSLGYLLTFVLAASGVASMHLTHANLRGLQWQLLPPEPSGAGGRVRLQVHADNPRGTRWGVGLAWSRSTAPRTLSPPPAEPVWVDLAAQGRTTVELRLPAPQRGWWQLPNLHVETRFPLGLFRAWAVWRPAATVTVWPQAEFPSPPGPPSSALKPGESPLATPPRPAPGVSDTLEWQGLRPYRAGDAPRLLAWKQMARWSAEPGAADPGDPSRRWSVHDWRAEPPAAGLPQALAWSATADLREPEARLSRLTAWVETLHAQGRPFSLELPPTELPTGAGEAHRRAALQALARWGCSDPAQEVSP